MTVRHKKVSGGASNGNASQVQPADWNDVHDLVGMLALLDAATPVADRVVTVGPSGAIELISKSQILLGSSPALTGVPTTPTAPTATNTTQVASTQFVQNVVAALIAAAPGALNTLDELAAAMGDDANFATTMTNALALKAALASPAFSGNPTVPNQAALTNNTRAANTAYADAAVAAAVALVVSGATASPGAVVNSSLTVLTAAHGGAATRIPADDTVPLITEGDQILTASFTAKTVTNKLRFTVRGTLACATTDNATVAVFAGSTCIGAQMVNLAGSSTKHAFVVQGEYTPGSVAAQTITVRVGGDTVAVYVNGGAGGRVLGGANTASLLIEEIKA